MGQTSSRVLGGEWRPLRFGRGDPRKERGWMKARCTCLRSLSCRPKRRHLGYIPSAESSPIRKRGRADGDIASPVPPCSVGRWHGCAFAQSEIPRYSRKHQKGICGIIKRLLGLSYAFFRLVHARGACHPFAVHPEQVRIFKAMPASRKLELAATFYFSARHLKTRALQQRHPDWSESRLRREVNDLFLRASC